MGIIKKIKTAFNDICEIKQNLEEVKNKSIEKERAYDDLVKYLPDLDIKLKKVYPKLDNIGNWSIVIELQNEPIVLKIDEEGNTSTNYKLRALNYLELLKPSEVRTILDNIAKVQDEIRKQKQKGG